MKLKTFFLTLLAALAMHSQAGITTYTFNSKAWASMVGSEQCDGVTDGWTCNSEASEYMKGSGPDAQGRIYSKGVSVKTATSGAGATSVKSFTNIRRLTLNFCLNSSRGKGVFYYQIGANQPDSLAISKPAESGAGVYLRDSVILLQTPQTGKIKFWVKCTENAININSLTIRAEEGGSNPFTVDSYNLVTDVKQLVDSDQIIIGVHKDGVSKIMGYFDEIVSQNNIHAINGVYSSDRTTVAANDEAVYTLRKTQLDGQPCFIIQDELRYELAFLVASGGQTKNRLALWTDVVDPKTYGNYGYWNITVNPDGEAVIMNLGNSKGKYIQYNANNSPTLFGCYPDPASQTPVAIYRLTKASGDIPAIAAPMVNFGTAILDNGNKTGEKTILVNANKLTQDITAQLKHADVFWLNTNTLDRDGDYITVSYDVKQPGKYIDTLVLQSGEVKCEAPVMITVANLSSIAQVVTQPDYTMVYLDEVEVTKKYDKYVFIRDHSGAMLIWDNGNLYAKGLQAGDKINGVCGRYQNYFGVPELAPTAQWTVTKGETAVPESVILPIDSADVCRLIRLENVTISDGKLEGNNPLPVIDAFNTGVQEGKCDQLDAIVMISWDEVQLWVVKQHNEPVDPTNIQTLKNDTPATKYFDGANILIRRNKNTYSITGKIVK